ncbi:cyclic nucleotide-binding domain-containing protein [Noviherbaspirillum cavernae]|uniref:Cyclic nucleotide-binding domain-containing protein n=1 Tax=Noviherbaspirillum cavernae TaxID=2320862 RepID=A0A418WYK1_9BURK|nr:cyclic nucleotide-binding domain-containing protein [Noviherbaspirillum cavernae]RJG05320.1 cyclic nucleotide-binding domain-containing protein [Noviherbaspirillum cavernae]
MELKVFLKNLPAFEEFKAQHLDVLANRLQVNEYNDGHEFITQGTQGEALYMLLQGSVRITRRDSQDDEEYEVRELSDGELFGIVSLVDNLPASATCRAKGRVKTAALTREAFQQLFHEASPIGHHLQYMTAVQMARDIQEENKRFRTALAKA